MRLTRGKKKKKRNRIIHTYEKCRFQITETFSLKRFLCDLIYIFTGTYRMDSSNGDGRCYKKKPNILFKPQRLSVTCR